MNDDQITLCCLLWAAPGQASALTEYEDAALALLPKYRARIVQRAFGSGDDGHPNEVQLLTFGSQADLDAFLADPDRVALTAVRDRVIAHTDLFEVSLHG